MDLTIQEKLKKVYTLVKSGATKGEQEAAKGALDKLLKKYNLEGIDLDSLDKTEYAYTYTTLMERSLLFGIFRVLINHDFQKDKFIKDKSNSKTLYITLQYSDWVTTDCAYEYFRRHMKAQWEKFCKPEIAKKRTAKTKKARREELMPLFFEKYIYMSGLYKEGDYTDIEASSLSKKEIDDRNKLDGIEGGQYNRQVTNGLMID